MSTFSFILAPRPVRSEGMKNTKMAQTDRQYLKHPLYHHGCYHQQPQQHQGYQYPNLHNVEHIKLQQQQQQQSQMLMTKPFSPAYVRIGKDV